MNQIWLKKVILDLEIRGVDYITMFLKDTV